MTNKIALVAKLALGAIVAGLLVGGLLAPAFGGVGLLAKNTADDITPLPLDQPPLPENSKILASDGSLIANYYIENRQPVKNLDQVAPIMRKALIDIEDTRFYSHGPIDLKGTLRALVENQTGTSVQGGSTLTQQYVKNVLFETAGLHKAAAQAEVNIAQANLKVAKGPQRKQWETALAKGQADLKDANAQAQGAVKQTPGRKIKEMRYALWVEENTSKNDILLDYLNTVFFGNQSYGIQAAAERYFSVPATQLTLAQSAMLAGMVNNATAGAYDPLFNAASKARVLTRRNIVLDRMAQLHTITQAQADAAKKEGLGLKPKTPPDGCVNIKPGYGYFCDYVKDEILNNPAFGPDQYSRQELLDTGGLTIRTTLDPKAQAAAQTAVSGHSGPTSRYVTMEALVQPGTGKILGIAQSRPYGLGKNDTTIDYAADQAHGGGGGVQAGSTFKIFTVAAAIDSGYKVSQSYPTPTETTVDGFRDCAGQLVGQVGGSWDVHNAEASKGGSEDMVTATWASTNTYFAQLEKDVGLCKVAKMAAKFGMTAPNGKPLSQIPAFTLGANEIDIVHEAAAYAGFAASGKYCSRIAIDSIADRNGKALPVPSANCSQVMDPDEANEVTSVLKGVLNDGAGTAHGYFDGLNGWDAAGKTGTTEGLANAVFAGYTRSLAAVVWEGDPEAPNGDPLSEYGASLVPTWQQTLEGALAGTNVPDFPSPTGDYGTGGISSGGNGNNQPGQGGGNGQSPPPGKGGHGGKGGKGGKGGHGGGHGGPPTG